MNQDIDTILEQDKSEGAMAAPLGPIVATPVLAIITSSSMQAQSTVPIIDSACILLDT